MGVKNSTRLDIEHMRLCLLRQLRAILMYQSHRGLRSKLDGTLETVSQSSWCLGTRGAVGDPISVPCFVQ